MSVDWKLIPQQREAQALRARIDEWDAAISTLEADLASAQQAEGAHRERVATLKERQTEIRFGNYPTRIVNGYPTSGPTDDAMAEFRRLDREIEEAEGERKAWLAQTGLNATAVAKRLERARISRGVLSSQLADVEGQLTAGQLVESGVPASDYEEHRQRVAALRERIGATS